MAELDEQQLIVSNLNELQNQTPVKRQLYINLGLHNLLVL